MLGNYELLLRLAVGGMATVYLALKRWEIDMAAREGEDRTFDLYRSAY